MEKQKPGFWKRYKGWIIGTSSVLAIAGISIGATFPFPTKDIDFYVSSRHIKLKNVGSLYSITDGGNINDGSFNEVGYKQVTSMAGEFNYEQPFDRTASSLIHAYKLAMGRGASVIQVSGSSHLSALKEFSHDFPEMGIIFIDSKLNIRPLHGTQDKQQGNVASVIFQTQETGYLAGYAASAWADKNHNSNPNKKNDHPLLSGVGGIADDAVVGYLAGFEQGMDKYNIDEGLVNTDRSVQLYIKDVLKQPAKYFGSIEPDPQNQVSAYAQQTLVAGVDVVFPAGGAQGATVIRKFQNLGASSSHVKVIGADQDLTSRDLAGFNDNKDWTKYVLGSAVKDAGRAIASLANSIFDMYWNGETPGQYTFTGTDTFGNAYEGKLENKWLSLTGGKNSNGTTQNAEDLYKSLGLSNLSDVIIAAKKATPKTPYYDGGE